MAVTNSAAAPEVTRWWWVRHAPIAAPAGVLHGSRDVDCDCGDAAAFRHLAAMLPRGAVWVDTPLRRTGRTADAIAAAGLADARRRHTEPAFAEQSFGAWEGRRWDDLWRDTPEACREFWRAPARRAPPEGESFADLAARAGAAVARLSRTHRGGDIVGVAHAGTIRAALAIALAAPLECALAFAVDCLSLTRLECVDGNPPSWRVLGVNHSSRPDMPAR